MNDKHANASITVDYRKNSIKPSGESCVSRTMTDRIWYSHIVYNQEGDTHPVDNVLPIVMRCKESSPESKLLQLPSLKRRRQ